MPVTCPTIDVAPAPAPTEAHITATSITPSVTTCQAVCSLTVSVTWTNQGDATGSFIPGLGVDSGVPVTLSSVTLVPNETYMYIFSITGLTEGSHTICPVPN